MSLTNLDYFNGLLSLIYAVVTIVLGLKIAMKYFKYKQRNLLCAGIAWAGMSESWLSSVISLSSVIITGKGLTPQMYAMIGIPLLPIFTFSWLIAFTDLKYKEKQKEILIPWIIYTIFFEIVFFYFLILDPDLIIKLNNPVDAEYQRIASLFILSFIITILITGVIFALDIMKSDNPKIKLKGKSLLAAFLTWCIAAPLDAFMPLNVVFLLFTRSLLISSAIMFYFGFMGKIEEYKEEAEKDDAQAFLAMTSIHKKESYTEEEILYHKEKRICLVCKGKISRKKKFVCPKCDILYCIRCSVALISLENICWVCESPMDPSKPVKISEEETIPDKKKLKKK